MNENDKQVPNEIPVKKDPGKSIPVKDPSTPSENNPINPGTDEPTGDKN